MARAIPDNIISHWHNLVGNMEASPLEFYAAVDWAIKERQVPDATTERIDFKERGLLSAKREYLRVKRLRYSFDICGAPFGTGFFFSWWLAEVPTKGWLIVAFVMMISTLFSFYMLIDRFGFFLGIFLWLVLMPVAFGLLCYMVREGILEFEDALLDIPIVGWLYERFFHPNTYYKMDTAQMFQSAIHSAVLQVVDDMTKSKGIRALSELERKPISRGFGKR